MNSPYINQQFFDNSGNPLSNGKLYTYTAGSTSLGKPVYNDALLTNPRPNPIILDASGRPGQYFLTSGGYNFVLNDQDDVLIESWDYQFGTGSGSTSDSLNDTYKVMSNSSDQVPNFLAAKLTGAGGISIGTAPFGNDTKTTITNDNTVRTDTSDSVRGFLRDKIVDSKTISWTTSGGVDHKFIGNVNIDNLPTVLPVWVILKNTDPTTAPFGLSQLDLEQIWNHNYGVAASEQQTTDPGPGDLSIWYLEGGTYWGDAVWVERPYQVGQMILNANHGLYDYLHTHPEDIQHEWHYSNYPAGLYTLNNDNSDGYLWGLQIVNQYPDPEYNTDSVLTYNGYEKKFVWVPNENFGGNGAVKIDQNDNAGFLGYKVQAGAGITITDTPNGSYGRFLSISADGPNPSGNGYVCTMQVANATTVLAPNLVGLRNELTVLFVPFADMKVTYNVSKFGCFLSQTGTGTLNFTLRDEQYRLIAASSTITNPSPSVFLELVAALVQDPITQTGLTSYTLKMGERYNLGISWTANGIQLLGDETNQNTNIIPYPAYKVDNITGGLIYQLTGGGEAKQRPFIRLITK